MSSRILKIETMGPRRPHRPTVRPVLRVDGSTFCRATGKRRFRTHAQAEEALEAAIRWSEVQERDQRVYRCQHCRGGYHLTSTKAHHA